MLYPVELMIQASVSKKAKVGHVDNRVHGGGRLKNISDKLPPRDKPI